MGCKRATDLALCYNEEHASDYCSCVAQQLFKNTNSDKLLNTCVTTHTPTHTPTLVGLFSHHCDSIGGQQLLRTHGCDVGNVGKHVNKGDHRDRDEDRTW